MADLLITYTAYIVGVTHTLAIFCNLERFIVRVGVLVGPLFLAASPRIRTFSGNRSQIEEEYNIFDSINTKDSLFSIG